MTATSQSGCCGRRRNSGGLDVSPIITHRIGLEDWAQALVDKLAATQAQIDQLMMEYCPGEMTPEQIAREWQHLHREVAA